MGQKVNPISNRLGIIRGWDSNWFGGKNYGDKLVEDYKIRKYLNARLAKAGIAKIVIERTPEANHRSRSTPLVRVLSSVKADKKLIS